MSAPLSEQQLAEIAARVAAATAGPWCTDSWEIYQGAEYVAGADWIGETCRAGEMDDSRSDAEFVAAARTDVPALLAEVERLTARVAELEAAGVEARAALGSLCYDLEDPGTAALGALYLISKATTGVEAQPDFAAEALAKRDAQVIRQAAETLEGADRDDDAVNLLYQLASDTEQDAAQTEAVTS